MASVVILKDPAVLAYLALSKAVGIVALVLPFALLIGNMVFTRLGSAGSWPQSPVRGIDQFLLQRRHGALPHRRWAPSPCS
jgi:hypothetical protein